MANRTRKIVLRVPVTPEKRKLIEQKMALLHTRNFSAYARKMLIDGYIDNMNTTNIQAQTAEIQKIGVNVNQIAKRLNSMRPASAQDIEDIKGTLAQAYQKSNNQTRHLIQSFAPGEATPEQAHEIGKQLADEVLQEKTALCADDAY